ncbi:MAG: PAS domain S-box protein [Acidobacteriia bacterium]|nr:PAS domain S-box protein [Terriglobia bacterium]
MRKIERREWWLWSSAVLVTLLLTLGIVSFVFPMVHPGGGDLHFPDLSYAARGLVGLVLLFDLYTVYQQLQIHRMRRRLVEGEELFRLITENAADMIAVVDAEGHRLYNSPAYQRVLGYSPEELRLTSSLEQIHPDDRVLVQEAAKEALRTGVGRRIEYRMRHKDGSWCALESTASTILNSDRKVEKLVIVNRDITGRRRLEQQFHQAQKMEAVGRLSGGVAHDFNNLLGVIIGYGEILEEGMKKEDPMRDSVDEILRAGRQAAGLTRQLLAFSRQQVLESKVLDLNVVITEVEKMLRRLIGEDVELTTVLSPGLGRVKADQGQIEQIILNMAVNARDAMPHGGKLSLETANVEIDEAFAQSSPYPVQAGPYVCLCVTDTGVGMDAATQAQIFEPFFTTKEKGKGTGLGLSMVYGVVKQSGGHINVYSEPGVGTIFRVYLPSVPETVTPEQPRANLSTSLRGTETVLLVEDEDGLRTLTRNLLERSGYTVLVAKDGNEGLLTSQQYKPTIHLLLTDVVMPGMGGPALAQQLIRQRPEIKTVYMSGYTGKTVAGHAVLDPGSFFLMKPFTRDGLASKIREALDSVPAAATQ